MDKILKVISTVALAGLVGVDIYIIGKCCYVKGHRDAHREVAEYWMDILEKGENK